MADIETYLTGAAIVNRVQRIMGLPVIASPAGSTDANAVQLWGMLTECGQELSEMPFEWQLFNKTHLITTTPGVLTYDLPSDFEGFVDATGWNRTARIPLIGPLTPQQWQLLEARQLGGTTLRMQYQISEGKIQFYFVPDDAQTIAIGYRSRAWVRDATEPLVFRDHVENDGDTVLFRARLMVSMLRYKWRDSKGFDTISSRADYLTALQAAKDNDKDAPDLGIGRAPGYPYLGYYNMPDTAFGGS